MSTSFFVFQAQRDLAQARTAEIQAISDYNKSLVDFEAVQEVPLGGGGGVHHARDRARCTRDGSSTVAAAIALEAGRAG